MVSISPPCIHGSKRTTATDHVDLMLQNPREADAMTKVQAELDETKVVLVSADIFWGLF